MRLETMPRSESIPFRPISFVLGQQLSGAAGHREKEALPIIDGSGAFSRCQPDADIDEW